MSNVEVSLQYLADDQDLAVYMASVGGGEVVPHKGNYVTQSVIVHDGRVADHQFDLERQGFRLVVHESKMGDFCDEGEIRNVYEPEVQTLVKQKTGAARVEVFDHTRRAASESVRKTKKIREPASTIHNDYTANSGPRRLREHFSDYPDEVEELLAGRFSIINVWRSINGPVENFPLAMCDASSVQPQDLVPVTREAKDRMGEIQFATYNPAHQWVYFPKMQVNETLLFKTYDSAQGGRARFTIHSSFDDPNASEDGPVRESIETRCFVFY